MCQPGRPWPQGLSQEGSPGLAAFQRAKSSGVVLALVHVDPRPARRSSTFFPRELAVGGEALSSNSRRPRRPRRPPPCRTRSRDEGDHLGDMLRGPRLEVGTQQPKPVEVLVEGLDVFRAGRRANRTPSGGPVDDLVVDVGEVPHVGAPRTRCAPKVPDVTSKTTLARACPMWHRSYTVTPQTYMPTLPGTSGTNGSFRFPIVLNTESVIPPHPRRFPGASPGAGPPPRRRSPRPAPRTPSLPWSSP